MLITQSLTYAYPTGKGFTFPDIALHAREELLVTGPSGIGKSTLLRLIGGFLPAASGSLKINAHEIVGAGATVRDKIRAANMGIVSQRPRAVQAISVLENMMLVPYFTKTEVKKDHALETLRSLGISQHANSKPGNMSVGEQQRLSIAMATVHAPKLLLADEPTSSLDSVNCEAVVELLKQQVQKSDTALLIISHDDRLAALFPNRIELK